MIRYSLSRKTVDFLRFCSIFGSWRGGGLFCSVSVFEVTASLKKESPIYRKTAIHRVFHTFSEYVFSMCTAVSAVLETSCCFGKGFISELQAILKETSPTAFCSYSSSLRLRTPDAFNAPNPNAMNIAAPMHRSQFVMELFPV